MKFISSICLALVSVLSVVGCQKRQQDQRVGTTVDSTAVATPAGSESISTVEPQDEISLVNNFYFIFDGSGSMRDPLGSDCGGDQTFSRKLDGAKWAVAEFLKKVPNDVNLGLYVFDERHTRDSECQVVSMGPNNVAAFLQAVSAIEAGGGTPLARALRSGVEILVQQRNKQLGYGEFRLVVVTDGLADDIPAAAEFANENAIPIYAIGLCIKEDHPLRQYALSYRAADNFRDLAEALETTIAETEHYDPKTFEVVSQ